MGGVAFISPNQPNAMNADEKQCPMCGETIKAIARRCRFCGEEFALDGRSVTSEAVREEAERLIREKQDKTTSWQLFVTGLIGCFAPILAIYGMVFLLRRSQPFPGKGLAIAGTLLHCFWTLALIGLYAFGAMLQF